MSWLAKSIANSLKLDDDGDGDYDGPNPSSNNGTDPNSTRPESDSPSAPTVKGDISELTKTLTRQFWGVASFLAPPPDPTTPPPTPNPSDPAHPSDPEPSDEDVISGIRSDFAEIGGKFKTGISKLSSNIAVSEFTKIASNLLQFGSEEEAEAAGAAFGVTQEVLAFVRNISMHPETWLDFPLSDDDEDSDDFELSDVQQEHALAVERLAPSLAALRIELCPEHMSESHFWMIYFVLLHPRLSKHDAELLSTPKIVEARAMLSHQLKKVTNENSVTDPSGSSTTYVKGVSDFPKEQHLSVPPSAQSDFALPNTSAVRSAPLSQAVDVETDKHAIQSSETQIIDKPVIEEGPVKETKYQLPLSNFSSKVVDEKYEYDGDDWLKEETSEMDGVGGTSIPVENDEDVSFSDLEEDDGDAPASYKKVTSGSDSSTRDSRDWVQLTRASADSDKESNSVEIGHSGSGQGKRLVFVTNNSTKSRKQYGKKFETLGLNVNEEEIFASSFAAAAYLKSINFPKDKKVYVIGEEGILKELELAGYQYLGGPEDGGKKIELKPGYLMEHDESVGAVVVGFDRNFNYYKIQYGTLCIRENPGCLFIATNRDAVTHLTDAQEWAGGGSMVGAISGSTQREPLVVGKPSTFMMDYLANEFGILKSQICMVGDRLDTDILFGQNGGCKTLLVLSGVTTLPVLQSPDNSIQPDFYTNKISDFLSLKAATV